MTVRPARAADGAPDVVRLKGGGMLRGTILTAVPGEPVRLRLTDGSERVFPAADVEFAGPESTWGGPAAAPSTVRVRLLGSEPNLTFFASTGSTSGLAIGSGFAPRGGAMPVLLKTNVASFGRLCTAPCETSLERGVYKIRLETLEGAGAEAAPLLVEGAGTIEGRFISRRGVRVAGVITALSSLIVGPLLAWRGAGASSCDRLTSEQTPCADEIGPLLLAGGLITWVGPIVGLSLLFAADAAETRFQPASP